MMRTERRQRAYDLTDGRCIYCRTRLADDENDVVEIGRHAHTAKEGYQLLCVTLRMPRALGGRATAANEVPACHTCSAVKGAKLHEVFVFELERKASDAARLQDAIYEQVGHGPWEHVYDALPKHLLRLLDNPPLPPERRRTGLSRRLMPAGRA